MILFTFHYIYIVIALYNLMSANCKESAPNRVLGRSVKKNPDYDNVSFLVQCPPTVFSIDVFFNRDTFMKYFCPRRTPNFYINSDFVSKKNYLIFTLLLRLSNTMEKSGISAVATASAGFILLVVSFFSPGWIVFKSYRLPLSEGEENLTVHENTNSNEVNLDYWI